MEGVFFVSRETCFDSDRGVVPRETGLPMWNRRGMQGGCLPARGHSVVSSQGHKDLLPVFTFFSLLQ